MADERPKPDPRVIAAYLDDVDLELDAAKRLIADPPNRFAAFHLEQAAEKLVKAVRLSRGLRVTADHNIEALVDELWCSGTARGVRHHVSLSVANTVLATWLIREHDIVKHAGDD